MLKIGDRVRHIYLRRKGTVTEIINGNFTVAAIRWDNGDYFYSTVRDGVVPSFEKLGVLDLLSELSDAYE